MLSRRSVALKRKPASSPSTGCMMKPAWIVLVGTRIARTAISSPPVLPQQGLPCYLGADASTKRPWLSNHRSGFHLTIPHPTWPGCAPARMRGVSDYETSLNPFNSHVCQSLQTRAGRSWGITAITGP